MKQDLRWKLLAVIALVLIFGFLISPPGSKMFYKGDSSIRYGLDLKGGIQLLLAPDYRIGVPQLTKLKEDLLAKLSAANIPAPTVDFLGTPDNNRCEGLQFTFASAADATRAKNVNAFPAKYKLDFFGESKNLVMEVNPLDPNTGGQSSAPANVVVLKVDQDAKDFPSDALDRAKMIVENRISDAASGMAEAQVRIDQNNRLDVQLPGINSLDQARDIITSTGRLTFRINNQVVVDGANLSVPDIGVNYQAGKGYVIHFKFTGKGAQQIAKVTTENVGKQMGVYLDETQLMNPEIREPLPDGSGQIEMGNSSKEEVEKNALLMKSGALPISLRVVQSSQVAPTLGNEIVRLCLLALAAGIILVILFMIINYGLPGVLADCALLVYGVLFLGVMALFRGVLTLPGIAGFILSLGMAVDANVIIFERIKDELRSGKRVRAAVDGGYHRAMVTIIDSNVTTMIAGGVLLFYGTGPVKGFAVTLCLGVLVHLFTAVVVTRTFIDLKIDRDPDRYAGQFGFKEGVQQ